MKDKISNSKEYIQSFLIEEIGISKNMSEIFNAFDLKALSQAEQQVLSIRERCYNGLFNSK